MNEITTMAIDLAKNVFQLHGVDGRGVCQQRRRVRRAQLMRVMAQMPPCLVAMEACASAHYWGREFIELGHRVKLIPPQYVKPFVRGNKTDGNDAEGICEAALRPRMPSVAVKTQEQQAVLAEHRIRQLLEGVNASSSAISCGGCARPFKRRTRGWWGCSRSVKSRRDASSSWRRPRRCASGSCKSEAWGRSSPRRTPRPWAAQPTTATVDK